MILFKGRLSSRISHIARYRDIPCLHGIPDGNTRRQNRYDTPLASQEGVPDSRLRGVGAVAGSVLVQSLSAVIMFASVTAFNQVR